jgi:pimeloyl-ACP methyl ester carboxylesterase
VGERVAIRTHWYELGAGDPVVLLHGGLDRGEEWREAATALAADHRVLVPDRRGHGGTPDVTGPSTYPAMAEETVAFLR